MRGSRLHFDEIEARVRFAAAPMSCPFSPSSDLNYLAEGGRLSKSSAFLWLLNIQPLLEVIDGELVPVEKLARTQKSDEPDV